jgi:hypothetical protein
MRLDLFFFLLFIASLQSCNLDRELNEVDSEELSSLKEIDLERQNSPLEGVYPSKEYWQFMDPTGQISISYKKDEVIVMNDEFTYRYKKVDSLNSDEIQVILE